MNNTVKDFVEAINNFGGVSEVVEAIQSGDDDRVQEIMSVNEKLKNNFGEIFEKFHSERSEDIKTSAGILRSLTCQQNSQDADFLTKIAFVLYISNTIDDFDKIIGVSKSGYGFEQGFVQFAGDDFEEIIKPRMLQKAQENNDKEGEIYVEKFFNDNDENSWLRVPGGMGLAAEESDPEKVQKMFDNKKKNEKYMFLAVKEAVTENLTR